MHILKNHKHTNKPTLLPLKSKLTNLILIYYRNNTENDTAFKRKIARKEKVTGCLWGPDTPDDTDVADGHKRENINVCMDTVEIPQSSGREG